MYQLKEAGVQTVPVEALDDVLDFTYNFINLTNQSRWKMIKKQGLY
jgi:hypothetical protein